MWELVVIVAILAGALAVCVVTMALHVLRVTGSQAALLDRLMATDWPSYTGYVEHQLQNQAPYFQRMPKPPAPAVVEERDDLPGGSRDLLDEQQQEAEREVAVFK